MIAALAAALLAAAPISAITFAPPATPLSVDTIEERESGGHRYRFSMRHEVRFSRLGQGWRMDATLRAYATDATGVPKAAYEAAMRPFVGVPTAVAVSAAGAPVGPLDAEATWARIAIGQRAAADAIATTRLPPAVAAALRARFEGIATLPRAERDAQLTEFAWSLLALSAPALRPGESQPYESVIAVPGAGAVTERGATAFASVTDKEASFTLDATVDPAELARIADRLDATLTARDPASAGTVAAAAAKLRAMRIVRHDRSRVDRATGLLIESVSHRATIAPGAAGGTVERTIRVAPAPPPIPPR